MSADEITPFYRELAKKTINENPSHIEAHLTALKRWIKSSPHLKVPENDDFLMSFLRYAHYDHALAQRRLDNYCSVRCCPKYEITEWFNYPPLSDPIVDKYLDLGFCIPCGTIESGVFFLIMRLGCLNPDVISSLVLRTMTNMNFEILLLNQCNQIGGLGIVVDMSCVSMSVANEWNERKKAKATFKLLQEACPGRVKHFVIYKENKLFDVTFKLIEMWMSEKMKGRVIRVKDDMTKAYEKLPGLIDVLPSEYGGKNKTVKDLIEANRKQFKEFYSKGYPLADIHVDDDLRPDDAKDYMREYQDTDTVPTGSEGTFIRIDPGD